VVARDRLPNAEAGGQTGPTGRSDPPPPVQRLAVIPPSRAVRPPPGAMLRHDHAHHLLRWSRLSVAARTSLDALLQCGEDSEYRRKAYDGYFEVWHVLLVEDGKSSPLTTRNFQCAAA
jgi:hypothetical protein